MAEKILKWAGGKEQILKALRAHLPKDYNHYHEPMIGSGTLFFDLEPDNGTINDTNTRLMKFYKQVRDQPNELIKECKSFKHPTAAPDPEKDYADVDQKKREIKNYYYQQRALFNRRPHGKKLDELEEAALFLYLNRTCYNGLYRENSDGEFNVPIGRQQHPDSVREKYWVREKQIREARKILKNVKIYNRDFKYVLNVVKPSDLIYFDPPYKPMSPTAKFTKYNAKNFGTSDQLRLLATIQKLNKKGVWVIVSNSSNMKNKYNKIGFDVYTTDVTRVISGDAKTRGEVKEIIATNIPPNYRRGFFKRE